jgi:metal-responsive CopG/Arc/MetJ family transcriptional regulator
MKTAISIPDPIFEAAEDLAKKMGISRSELYARAVEGFVQTRRGEEITAALNRIYAEESSELDPVLAKLQFDALRPEDWS